MLQMRGGDGGAAGTPGDRVYFGFSQCGLCTSRDILTPDSALKKGESHCEQFIFFLGNSSHPQMIPRTKSQAAETMILMPFYT